MSTPVVTWTMDEVADMLRVDIRTVKRMVASGDIGSIKVGRLRRITQEQLDAYVARGGSAAA